MGEIKVQLAEEAETDRVNATTPQPGGVQPGPVPVQQGSSLIDRIIREFGISSAHAQAATRKDEMSVTLQPGEATEIKLTMSKGAKAAYEWTAQGGGLNYDMHADGNGGQTTSYKKGRSEPRFRRAAGCIRWQAWVVLAQPHKRARHGYPEDQWRVCRHQESDVRASGRRRSYCAVLIVWKSTT
ncbi:hypothetical protein J5289_06740 [Rhizobium sp. B230/85]|uniref:hypothetical protein n=1 Tax=unclassified Rhizobium TaxID=2613769 RepID=UPI001ADC70AC|nr:MULTISPECIES: hypothetical protein [unclassified Rhizobium]MBO9133577.1 hypothetical protein [Rhizobium sp. B209b/85]QXZ97260.1 hypothetical protein J5289_06740 [Rhizobium sp. B230/85]